MLEARLWGRLRLAFLLPQRGPNKSIGRRLPPILRDYEIMFIVDPTVSDEEIGTIQERLSELAVSRGGEAKKIGVWERRRLAHEIRGRRDGVYVIAQVRGEPSLVREMERQLRVTESVLRHIVVRLDED